MFACERERKKKYKTKTDQGQNCLFKLHCGGGSCNMKLSWPKQVINADFGSEKNHESCSF